MTQAAAKLLKIGVDSSRRSSFRVQQIVDSIKNSIERLNQQNTLNKSKNFFPEYDLSLVPNYSDTKLRDKIVQNYDFVLSIEDNGISLQHISNMKGGPSFTVDFTSGKMEYRRKQNKDKKSPLIRSVTIKSKPLTETKILDATGGWGIDTFVMAYSGASVTVVEQNPIVYEMVKDALERAKKSQIHSAFASRITLVNENSMNFIPKFAATQKPDVIYLDPFYPSKKRMKIQHQKHISLLREIVGVESETHDLLDLAKQYTDRNVVLKRPYYVPVHTSAHRTYKAVATHFDVIQVDFSPNNPIEIIELDEEENQEIKERR